MHSLTPKSIGSRSFQDSYGDYEALSGVREETSGIELAQVVTSEAEPELEQDPTFGTLQTRQHECAEQAAHASM